MSGTASIGGSQGLSALGVALAAMGSLLCFLRGRSLVGLCVRRASVDTQCSAGRPRRPASAPCTATYYHLPAAPIASCNLRATSIMANNEAFGIATPTLCAQIR